MKICLLGAQGTGKSTLLKEFCHYPYSEFPIYDGVARSVIKKGGTGNESGNVRSQRAIFNGYEKCLIGESYLSTRSMIDVVAYTIYLYEHKKVTGIKTLFEKIGLWFEIVRESRHIGNWLKNNSDIVICYVPVEFEIEEDGVRSTNKQYQRDIDDIMVELFNGIDLSYKCTISGTLEQRKAELEKIIKARQKIEKKSHS